MSQTPPTSHVHVHAQPTNGLGTAGFVTSLVGIVTCGFLCPIGLLMSLIALGKEPRGMAIAGAIIGGLGSLAAVAVLAFFGAILAALGIGVAAVADQAHQETMTREASHAIIDFYDANGQVAPGQAEGDRLASKFEMEGHAFSYEREDDKVFYIIHPGEDGTIGTEDDWRVRWNAEVESMIRGSYDYDAAGDGASSTTP